MGHQSAGKRVTLQDIAKKTGYSLTAVSRALRNMSDIGPEATAFIQQTAKEMGYVANQTAVALRYGRTNCITVIVIDLTNPFFSIMANYMQLAAHEMGYSYTRETLERLTAQNPDVEYYFIMGADSLFTFEEWKDPERISQLAVLVAAVRDHVSDQALELQIQHLSQKFECDIRILDAPNMDVSSRMLREWIREGKSVRYYLPDPVISYIKNTGLYHM